MKLLTLPIVMLVCIMFVSCGEKKSEAPAEQPGVRKYYYPDGPVYMEVHMKDTIPHGPTTEYFRDGKIYQLTEYAMGKKHGVSKRYHEDGTLAFECSYDSGRRHGVEKKYRKDGTLAYEAPYIKDQPAVGLKEYYTSGDLVTKYGSIVVKEENKMFDYRFSLLISLSEDLNVEFYAGKLTDGKYIGDDCRPLYEVSDGVSRVDYNVGPGQFLMDDINIIAKIKTDLNNYKIIQRYYAIAVDNR